MLSSIGRCRARDYCVIALFVTVSACATGGDTIPPASVPQPIALAGPQPSHASSRIFAPPARVMSTRSAARTALPRTPAPPRAEPPRAPKPTPRAEPVRLSAVRMDSAALEREVTRRFAYQPLSLALAKRTSKTELADRIAAAVVYEAARLRMSPSLLAAVLLIENAPFDTTAVSNQGAVGLMQVMPVHVGSYGCSSEDLNSVEANICHGARLLNTYMRRSKSVPLGLKRYNGCVRGRNTPRCYRYPTRVLRTASRVRHDVLLAAASLEESDTAESADIVPDGPVVVPSQPVVSQDSLEAATLANECSTLLGCLRRRWTQR
ncbi:MAG TPA: transglycosylase SLT domain-containing protein [Gemmatimonadales bacterium]|nr:transglycosylase SLT domain-containing protein [Gemmatimonadales bacterium]